MATQMYIEAIEQNVMAVQHYVKEAMTALECELKINDGFIYPQNRDAWDTLFVNAQDAVRKLNELVAALDKAL